MMMSAANFSTVDEIITVEEFLVHQSKDPVDNGCCAGFFDLSVKTVWPAALGAF